MALLPAQMLLLVRGLIVSIPLDSADGCTGTAIYDDCRSILVPPFDDYEVDLRLTLDPDFPTNSSSSFS